MKEFKDLADTSNIRSELKEAYEKGYHFEWIGKSIALLDQLLKAFIFLAYQNKEITKRNFDIPKKYGKEVMDHLFSMTLGNTISIAYILDILSDNLYYNLKQINGKRNLVFHHLISKVEDIKQIKIDDFFNLCDKSMEMLSNEMVLYQKHMDVAEKISQDVIKGLKDRIKEEEDKWENKRLESSS